MEWESGRAIASKVLLMVDSLQQPCRPKPWRRGIAATVDSPNGTEVAPKN